MKAVQKTSPSPRPVKRKGRYASEQEALKAKQEQLLTALKEVDLKNLSL